MWYIKHMKIRTVRQALKITKDLWIWLSNNPQYSKEDCDKPDVTKMESDCPCCEYAAYKKCDDCSSCPLLSYWQSFSTKRLCPCTDETSPYILWQRTNNLYARAKYALQIANACDRKLKRLEKPKRKSR